MSNTLRTWMAGLLLACTVLLVVATADSHDLSVRGMLAMTVVLCHAWVIAVAERASSRRGGLHLTRFPIGPRLLATRPGVTPQCLIPAVLIGVILMDWRVSAFGVALVLMFTVDLLRRWLPYLIPGGLVLIGVSNMQEFHTLGDLVETARGWMFSLMWLVVWVTLLAGPLLRTDVAGKLPPTGKLALILAGLPGYAAALFVLGHTSLGEQLPDMLGVALVLLAGGVVQSVVLALVGRAVGLGERDAEDVPELSAHDIGVALMPFGLVLLAVVGLEWLQVSSGALGRGTPGMWQALLIMGLVIPAVPAAGLVASALDRVDGRSRGMAGTVTAVSALALWFAFGPAAMRALYIEGGLIDGLSGLLPGGIAARGVFLGTAEGLSVSTLLPAHDMTIWGMPAADMLRACTLMLLAVAAWSARLMRHAPERLSSPGSAPQIMAALVAGLVAWIFVPRIGPVAAPLAVAAAATLAMGLDLVTGVKQAPVESDEAIDALEFSSPLLDELAMATPEAVPDVVTEARPTEAELKAQALLQPRGFETDDDPPPASDLALEVEEESDELSFADWNDSPLDEAPLDEFPLDESDGEQLPA